MSFIQSDEIVTAYVETP